MAKQTTGEFLATLRKANGYTQSDVAEKLNISNRTLSSWETDRTMPDILLLPTIADLYGVSVDEILRGERTEKAEPNKISQQALMSSRKSNWGKFTARSTLIYGIAIIGTFVLLLTSVILPFTNSPLWLNILLGVSGGICIAVCITLIFYFEYKLLIKEGIILKEDLTPENKALLLSAKRKIYNLTLILALILALVIFVLLAEFIFLLLYLLPFILLIVYSVACFSLLLFSIIYRKSNILAYGNEEQLGVLKANKRFAVKTFGFSAIPAVLLAILCTVCCVFLQVSETAYFETKDFSEFQKHTQALTITEGSYEARNYNCKPGEYMIAFPENPQENVYYELNENQFFGKKSAENAWTLYYKFNDEYKEIMTVIIMQLNGNDFVNIRYRRFFNYDFYGNRYHYNSNRTTITEKFWGEQETHDGYFKYENGKYGFYRWDYNNYTDFAIILTAVGICTVYIIATLIYLIKQKKIKYAY